MKRVYLLLTQVDSIVMRIIRLYTGAKYNHVSISIDDMKTFYSFGRKIMYFPVVGGFVKEELNKGTYKHFGNVRCIIYSLDITDEAYEKLADILEVFIRNQDRYGYNFAALLGIVLNRPLKLKNCYTCSEFTAMLLQSCGIYKFNKDLSLVIPMEFNMISGLTRIHEGRMDEFTGDVLLLQHN